MDWEFLLSIATTLFLLFIAVCAGTSVISAINTHVLDGSQEITTIDSTVYAEPLSSTVLILLLIFAFVVVLLASVIYYILKKEDAWDEQIIREGK